VSASESNYSEWPNSCGVSARCDAANDNADDWWLNGVQLLDLGPPMARWGVRINRQWKAPRAQMGRV